MEVPSGAAPTAWGDAQARKRDIVASAENLLEQSGYAALTMRAIAAGAGVSPGTVYQYFDGKEAVFVALTTRRLEQVQATLYEVDRTIGVAGVLREIMPQIVELWRRLGRSASQWEAGALASGKRSENMATSATVYTQTLQALAQTLDEAAELTGQTLVDDPVLPHWVWDSLIGVADDLMLGGARQNAISGKQLIDFAACALERSIDTGERVHARR